MRRGQIQEKDTPGRPMGEIISGGVEYFMNGRKGSASFQVQWHK
jgi:hypothetical protein